MVLDIRDETASDAPGIRAVLESAFGETMEADIVDALRDACPDRISLVAWQDDRLAGHILFTPATIDRADGPIAGFALAPMAVTPDLQRTGIGSALIRAGLERLRAARCPFIVVVGHPEYYPKFGFVAASRFGVRCQWDSVTDEAFMILVNDTAAGDSLAGLARFRPEFDQSV